MVQKIKKQPIMVDVSPRSHISEAYRSLRTDIDLYDDPEKLKVITVTSSYPGEGKTTTAVNLAVAFAQANKKVLLIDAAFNNPVLQDIFLIPNHQGLSDVLSNEAAAQDMIQSTHIPNLSILTSGVSLLNPSDLLSSDSFTSVIQRYRKLYDKVIIDTSPLFAMSETLVVAAKSDGVLLIIEQGKVKTEVLEKCKQTFERFKVEIVGIAINKINKKYIS